MKYIQTYRKKPIEVEAVQISKDAIDEILEWGDGKIELLEQDWEYVKLEIDTATGCHCASTGDFLVKGVDGNIYAIPRETFYKLYETDDENSSKNHEDGLISW